MTKCYLHCRTKRIFELYIGDPYKTTEDMEDLYGSSDEEDYITSSSVNHDDSLTNQSHDYKESDMIGQDSVLERSNRKESLRLSLPVAEDDYDETDDVDTERYFIETLFINKFIFYLCNCKLLDNQHFM